MKIATKLVSTKYPTVAAHVNNTLQPGTVDWRNMRRALTLGHPILDILSALEDMAASHASRYGSTIAQDGVLGGYWIVTAKNARRMLDGEFGQFKPISNGCVEWYFWQIVGEAGFTEAEVEAA